MSTLTLWDFFIDPVLRAPTLGSIFMCLASSLVGVIVVIKRQSLLGETLSHACYPGVVISSMIAALFFDVSSDISSFIILVGAFVFSLFGLWVVEQLERKLRISSDAALCFVLSTFLGLGILIASRIQFTHPLWYRNIQVFLYGQAATMHDKHIWLYVGLSLSILFFIILQFRKIELVIFDRTLATLMGLRIKYIDAITYTLIIIALVLGIRSVGVILMSGMLIAPAVAARQFTNQLGLLFFLSGIFGMISGYGGNVLSVEIPLWLNGNFSLPTGPMILLVAVGLAFFSLLFAPKRGVISRMIRISRFRFQCRVENILKTFWKLSEKGALHPHEIILWNHLRMFQVWGLLRYMIIKGWILKEPPNRYLLTREGKKRATHLVRLHRLWEVYLVNCLKIGEEKVHRNAEEMEHIITPELEIYLIELLQNPKKDPHEQPIPQKEETL